jgi:hypothetical protein
VPLNPPSKRSPRSKRRTTLCTSFPSTHSQQTPFSKFGIIFLLPFDRDFYKIGIGRSAKYRLFNAWKLVGGTREYHWTGKGILLCQVCIRRSAAIKPGRPLRGDRTTGYQVTWENYLEWQKSHPSPGPAAGSEIRGTASTGNEGGKSAQLTFQQITDLINTGQTHLIPNNDLIPEALHVRVLYVPSASPRSADCAVQGGPPSESTNPTRRKPWERPDEIS